MSALDVQQLCKIDTFVFLAMVFYACSSALPDVQWETSFVHNYPAGLVEVANLLLQGLVERCIVLPAIAHADERGWTKSIRFRPLPGTLAARNTLLKDATEFPSPLLHNKNAILFTLAITFPSDWLLDSAAGHDMDDATDAETFITAKGLCLSLVLGLVVIDLILGTAHMLSHTGSYKWWLWKHHALHHTKHENYVAVKFHGETLDLEVFLTQVCIPAEAPGDGPRHGDHLDQLV